MLGDIVMIEKGEGEKKNLNNTDLRINRGFELLLNKRRKKLQKPKLFKVSFGKIFSLLHREIDLYFEISLDLRKNNSREN